MPSESAFVFDITSDAAAPFESGGASPGATWPFVENEGSPRLAHRVFDNERANDNRVLDAHPACTSVPRHATRAERGGVRARTSSRISRTGVRRGGA
jgi:hypothetical protein